MVEYQQYLTNVSQILSSTTTQGLQAYFLWQAIVSLKSLVVAPEMTEIDQIIDDDFNAEVRLLEY
jgi:hypothetical protein